MKRLVLLISFTSFAIVLFSQEDYKQEVLELENKADSLFKEFRYDSAVYYHLRIAELRKNQSDWLSYAKQYRKIAILYKAMHKIDSATNYIEKALKISDSLLKNNIYKEEIERINILVCCGEINHFKEDYKKALNNYEIALSIISKSNSNYKLKEASLWYELGETYLKLSELDKAFEFYSKSLETRKKYLEMIHEDIAESLNGLGTYYRYIRNYEKAISYHQKALKIHSSIYGKENQHVVNDYNNLAIIYHRQGKFEIANDNYQKALAIFNKIPLVNPLKLGQIFNNLGVLNVNKGNYEASLEYYLKSLSIYRSIYNLDNIDVADIYNNIGVVYYYKFDYEKAIINYQEALKIKLKILGKLHPSVALSYNNIGTIYYLRNEYDTALDFYNKALKIRTEVFGNKHPYVANIYNNMGAIYEYKNELLKALQYHKKALEIRRFAFGDKSPNVARSYDNVGLIYKSMKDFKNALNSFQKAMRANLPDFNDTITYSNPTNFNAYSKPYLQETIYHKAKTQYLSYLVSLNNSHIDASIETFNLLFDIIHLMRLSYSNENTTYILNENSKLYFVDAILAANQYYEIGKNKKTKQIPYEYLEKSKSATLGAYLENIQVKNYLNISDSLLNTEKHISENRRSLETNIQKAKAQKNGYDTLKVEKFQNELFYASRQYDSLVTTLKNKYPDYYLLKYQQKVASIDEIQQQLDNKTALLNFFVADTSLFIAAVTKDTLVYKVIKTDSSFNELLTDYHIDIEFDFTKDELQASKKLYNYLIAPVENLIRDKNKLVILPDEKLYYVPFETLCKNGSNISQPDYLIKNYAINYHHSATLWLNSKEKESKNITQSSFIGFAPVFDPQVNNGSILSNEWIADTTQTNVATRSVSNDFNHFNALPNSEKEIKSILKLFKKKDGKAEGYLHKEATEENFKNNVSDYKYIHIASHSFTNDKYPALSGIAFSQPDTSIRKENDEDGILYAGESYNLNLSNAHLVVLSSCKSGLGKLIKGEGFLSLSRGFIYSGAPNIVYSLWSVNDEPTKNLMVHFYKKLLSGISYAEALREAKLKILSNSKTSQPKYWAAWVLLGK